MQRHIINNNMLFAQLFQTEIYYLIYFKHQFLGLRGVAIIGAGGGGNATHRNFLAFNVLAVSAANQASISS